jgi:hypothetical protein
VLARKSKSGEKMKMPWVRLLRSDGRAAQFLQAEATLIQLVGTEEVKRIFLVQLHAGEAFDPGA